VEGENITCLLGVLVRAMAGRGRGISVHSKTLSYKNLLKKNRNIVMEKFFKVIIHTLVDYINSETYDEEKHSQALRQTKDLKNITNIKQIK
jgi:hypothetical protein